MPTVEVSTVIRAPRARCYQLALSVDLHALSTARTGEQIVGGVRSGLLQLGDSVTFRARHFGVWQQFTSKVTETRPPAYFCDEMQRGAFRSMRHEHYFTETAGLTEMRDVFHFVSPLGPLGRLADALVLRRYLRRFLAERGAVIKHYAETDAWQQVLPGTT
ncbi:cell division protein [Hymenobacter gummosus]|uniref:Cell division protein n=1 Tax=Hymenobacter gummosus TaxID=1776032 RepID=A0A3S0JDA4_9BACT|nr:SRPBCC family protein [Hymenobacter gummosus]RTQ45599.1 cell division protein [Hymenobacter gummosus]